MYLQVGEMSGHIWAIRRSGSEYLGKHYRIHFQAFFLGGGGGGGKKVSFELLELTPNHTGEEQGSRVSRSES